MTDERTIESTLPPTERIGRARDGEHDPSVHC
jgi:hypothetical protein